MKERDLERGCWAVLQAKLAPMPLLWHINDQATGGLPDTEVVWNGHTTKLEFKKLKNDQTIHDVWEDARQLLTCVQYERASGGRCWVVAFQRRKGLPDRCIIYRPTKLLNKAVPHPETAWDAINNWPTLFESLWNRGALAIQGWPAGNLLIAALIRETHK